MQVFGFWNGKSHSFVCLLFYSFSSFFPLHSHVPFYRLVFLEELSISSKYDGVDISVIVPHQVYGLCSFSGVAVLAVGPVARSILKSAIMWSVVPWIWKHCFFYIQYRHVSCYCLMVLLYLVHFLFSLGWLEPRFRKSGLSTSRDRWRQFPRCL